MKALLYDGPRRARLDTVDDPSIIEMVGEIGAGWVGQEGFGGAWAVSWAVASLSATATGSTRGHGS